MTFVPNFGMFWNVSAPMHSCSKPSCSWSSLPLPAVRAPRWPPDYIPDIRTAALMKGVGKAGTLFRGATGGIAAGDFGRSSLNCPWTAPPECQAHCQSYSHMHACLHARSKWIVGFTMPQLGSAMCTGGGISGKFTAGVAPCPQRVTDAWQLPR